LMNEGELQQVGTPEEVYDDPDNLFVAGFVGDPPMNLLRGRARKTERGMSMWLSDETDLPVPSSFLSPDQQVVVGIRPQDVHVVESDGPDVLHATVFAFEPLQETGLLTATLPGVETRIEAETDPHARFNREEAVRLRFDPDRISLFDAESGDRIR
jgi:multiple sugar transport system ATP-binding protein